MDEKMLNLKGKFFKYIIVFVSLNYSNMAHSACKTPKLPSDVQTENAVSVSVFGNWQTLADEHPRQCWVFSKPVDFNVRTTTTDEYWCRSSANFYILYEPNNGIRGQPSIKFGYQLDKEAKPQIFIGDKVQIFEIISGEYAWLANTQMDISLVELMTKAIGRISVVGVSESGYVVTDEYNLDGFSEANLSAKNACIAYPMS